MEQELSGHTKVPKSSVKPHTDALSDARLTLEKPSDFCLLAMTCFKSPAHNKFGLPKVSSNDRGHMHKETPVCSPFPCNAANAPTSTQAETWKSNWAKKPKPPL